VQWQQRHSLPLLHNRCSSRAALLRVTGWYCIDPNSLPSRLLLLLLLLLLLTAVMLLVLLLLMINFYSMALLQSTANALAAAFAAILSTCRITNACWAALLE
jgi:hypothetical protein